MLENIDLYSNLSYYIKDLQGNYYIDLSKTTGFPMDAVNKKFKPFTAIPLRSNTVLKKLLYKLKPEEEVLVKEQIQFQNVETETLRIVEADYKFVYESNIEDVENITPSLIINKHSSVNVILISMELFKLMNIYSEKAMNRYEINKLIVRLTEIYNSLGNHRTVDNYLLYNVIVSLKSQKEPYTLFRVPNTEVFELYLSVLQDINSSKYFNLTENLCRQLYTNISKNMSLYVYANDCKMENLLHSIIGGESESEIFKCIEELVTSYDDIHNIKHLEQADTIYTYQDREDYFEEQAEEEVDYVIEQEVLKILSQDFTAQLSCKDIIKSIIDTVKDKYVSKEQLAKIVKCITNIEKGIIGKSSEELKIINAILYDGNSLDVKSVLNYLINNQKPEYVKCDGEIYNLEGIHELNNKPKNLEFIISKRRVTETEYAFKGINKLICDTLKNTRIVTDNGKYRYSFHSISLAYKQVLSMVKSHPCIFNVVDGKLVVNSNRTKIIETFNKLLESQEIADEIFRIYYNISEYKPREDSLSNDSKFKILEVFL